MVGNRSPGINFMSYSYFIHDLRRSMIIETDGSDSYVDSYKRTKEWFMSSYPEFLI